MGSYRLELTMQIFVLLATLAAAFAAPAPQDEDIPAAIPYVHEEIVAEPYVHEDIAAEPYVHIEPENTVEEIAAEPYVHEDPEETHAIEAEPYVHEEPTAPVAVAAPVVSYAAFPYATHAYT